MRREQPGILEPLPSQARYLFFTVRDPARVAAAMSSLASLADGRGTVVGVGPSAVAAVGAEVDGLRVFPSLAGEGIEVPSTPAALWCWLRGDDRGELVRRSRRIAGAVAPAFRLDETIDAFVHDSGRDMTGYEDGTENPEGDRAVAAAVVAEGPLAGSSFVAVQRWVHDFDRFEAMLGTEQDAAIGRRRSDNEELDDAPPSAHVKRTAQESFDPEAFVVRRSMPWADPDRAGLVFVAFGRSVDAFEAQLRRMIGAEDGITDALFGFTRPVSGAYFWCPPVVSGRLDLRRLGL